MSDDMTMQDDGYWHEMRGKAKQVWGNLTDDDLKVAEGNLEEFLGKIQAKTGESLETIREKLNV